MKWRLILSVAALVVFSARGFSADKPAASDWTFNASIIEACSCPMFCQCYFNSEPAGHAGHEGHAGGHFCRFNNAFKVNQGKAGDVSLDGAKFWVAGDLGGDFSKGQMDWAVLTFDKAVTPAQRTAIQEIVGHIYPVKWNSFKIADDAAMDWTANKDTARAALGDGKVAEVSLKRNQGMTDAPIVIKNLKYWGVPRNDGFVMMQNEVEAYRTGDKPFEYKKTNGFMITLDINSKDVASASPAGM